MALADKHSDSDKHKITNSSELAKISASFADGKHIDLQAFPGEAALLFQLQNMEEDIKEIRRFIISENKASITTLTEASQSFSTRVTANDSKITTQFPTPSTKVLKSTAAIVKVLHTPGAEEDSADTLSITLAVFNSKGQPTSQKIFRLTSQ